MLTVQSFIVYIVLILFAANFKLALSQKFAGLQLYYNTKIPINSDQNILLVLQSLGSETVTVEIRTPYYIIASFQSPTDRKFQQTKNLLKLCNQLSITEPPKRPTGEEGGFYLVFPAKHLEVGTYQISVNIFNSETSEGILKENFEITVRLPEEGCFPQIYFPNCATALKPKTVLIHKTNIFEPIVSRGCGVKSQLKYNWTIRNYVDQETLHQFPMDVGRVLRTPPLIFWFDDVADRFHSLYTVKVIVEEKSPNGQNGVAAGRCYISLAIPPPMAIIKYGSSRIVYARKPFELDGSESLEFSSIRSGINLRYEWRCTTNEANKYCKGIIGRTMKITVPPNKLSLNKKYNFRLNVTSTRTGRSSQTTQQITPVDQYPLQISYKCIRNCFHQKSNMHDPIHLQGLCDNCPNDARVPTFKWSKISPGKQDLKSSGSRLITSASELAVSPEKLGQVTLKLEVEAGRRTGFVQFLQKFFPFEIVGGCEVEPKQGTEYLTVFRITCIEFESINVPLQFQIFQNDRLLVSQTSNEIRLKLVKSEGSDSADLKIVVSDEIQARVELKLGVPLSPRLTSPSVETIFDVLESKVNQSGLRDYVLSGDVTSVVAALQLVGRQMPKLPDVHARWMVTEHVLRILSDLTLETVPAIEKLSGGLKTLLSDVQSKDTLARELGKMFSIINEAFDNSIHSGEIFLFTLKSLADVTKALVAISQPFYNPIEKFPSVQNEEFYLLSTNGDYPDYGPLDFDIIYRINNWKYFTDANMKLFQNLARVAFYVCEPEEADCGFTVGNLIWNTQIIGHESSAVINWQTNENAVAIPPDLLEELLQPGNENGKVAIQTVFVNQNPYWWFPDEHIVNTDPVVVNIFSTKYPNTNFILENLNLEFDIFFKIKENSTHLEPKETCGFVKPLFDMPIYECTVPGNSYMVVEFLNTSRDLRVLMKIGNFPKYREVVHSSNRIESKSLPFAIPTLNSFTQNSRGYVAVLQFETDLTENINFVFRTSIYSCQHWSVERGEWSMEYCSAGDKTNTTHIHCRCGHLSSFAAKVFKTPNTLELPRDVIAALATNTVFLFAFLILILIISTFFYWSMQADRKQQSLSEVVFIEEYDPNKTYMYLVTIQTGEYRYAGTTANITVQLHGNDRSTEEITMSRQKFPRAFIESSENTFAVMTSAYLGEIHSISLHNDYTGRYPSWYCRTIRIKDTVRKEEFVFIVNQWLSKIYNDSVDITVTPATARELNSRKSTLIGHLVRCFTEMYLWYGLFYPHPRSALNRKEKTMVFVTGLCFGLMLSIMFFGRTTLQNIEEERVEYRRFVLTLTNVLHTILCTIVGVMLGMTIVTLILKGKTSDVPYKIVYGKED